MGYATWVKAMAWIVTAITVFLVSAFQIFQTRSEAIREYGHIKDIKSDLCLRLDKVESKIDSILTLMIKRSK